MGTHFKLPVHEKAYFRALTPNSEFHRMERKKFWIRKLETKNPHGLNQND